MKPQPLAIYVDHTSRFAHNTGIQRCVRAISRALEQLSVPLVPLVWDRHRQDFGLASLHERQRLAEYGGPSLAAWSLDASPRWLLIIELVRGPTNPSPEALRQAADRRQWRVAWVVHDTLPLRWDADPVRSNHERYLQGLGLFELVLANSHATARDLRACFAGWSCTTPPIEALPLAEELPDPGLNALGNDPASGPQVLCVSSLEPRKNHLGLLKAVAWLAAQQRFSAQLTLVGWAHHPVIARSVQRAQECGAPVRWLASVSDSQLLRLYRQALFCVYPSLEEGFGLPVVEALQQGKPCLCSNAGALAELAAGGGCSTVSTHRWRALAAGLEQLLHDHAYREALVRQASARLPRPWTHYATELMARLQAFEARSRSRQS